MVKRLRVMLWGSEVGQLVWDAKRKLAYFVYNPTFIRRGIEISPLAAPASGVRGLLPVWGEETNIYQKLPAFLADSLPDSWGNQLFELWRQQSHLSNSEVTPLDKLSFIGKRGMGALEFLPDVEAESKSDKIDVKNLAELAERIFIKRENARILPEESITMQSLLTVGTSAGGRQPKAIIARNKKTGEIRSGQIYGLTDFDYYLLKFGDSSVCSAELEMAYYDMAKAAGINMMSSELLDVDGNNHFLTTRFDRENGKKLHTQTLAAIDPEAKSYEQLVDVCRRLNLPETDIQEVFRRMVFNILANNTDDHHKNFSFIMSPKGEWRLSPAYDLTFIVDRGGYMADQNHCMYVRAKLHDISRNDAMDFAADNGVRKPETIIQEVATALKQFRRFALKHGVSEQWIGRVEAALIDHLKDWGEWEDDKADEEYDINGHSVSNVRLEPTYKGNFHLFANIDGKERKHVITKNKEVYAEIEKTGVANVTADRLRELVGMYMVL